MDPTETERNAIGTLGDAATSVLGSLFRILGCNPDMPLRVIASIREEDYTALSRAWQHAGDAPSPALASQEGIFGRVCTVICGTQRAPPPASPPRLPTETEPMRDEKGSGKEACDDERDVLAPESLQKAYDNYRRCRTHYSALYATEQLACLDARVREKRPPYIDFAVWGPHGQRIARRLKFKGVGLDSDGSLGSIEIAGPPSFHAWDAGTRRISSS